MMTWEGHEHHVTADTERGDRPGDVWLGSVSARWSQYAQVSFLINGVHSCHLFFPRLILLGVWGQDVQVTNQCTV